MIGLYDIFLQAQRKLLNENLGREMSHARKMLRSYGYSDENAKKLVEHWETKPCFRRSNGRFMKGFARLFATKQITDGEIDKKSKMIEKIIDLISRKYSDIFTTGLETVADGYEWSANELINKFQDEVKQELEDSIENGQNKGITKSSDYEFVRIPTFSDAGKYEQYTDWCVTHGASNYNSYTDNGEGIFIFCLQHGFEDIPREATKGCPMDEYGKSMIAISVDAEGDLNTCTCRWNHANGGNDQMMNREEIEEFFGVNFAETFYPRTEDEEFEDEDLENPERWEEDCLYDMEYIGDIDGVDIYLTQSPETCAYRQEMADRDSAEYGLYVDESKYFISDTEYYLSDFHSIGYNHIIMKRDEDKHLYDIYLWHSNEEADSQKNIYAWKEIGDGSWIIGSYLDKDVWGFFVADLGDIGIWNGKVPIQNIEITMSDPTQFAYLEDYTEEVGYSNEEYVIIKNGDKYTITEVSRARIICHDAKLKFPEDIDDYTQFMPFYDEEEDIYYLETEDGIKYDAIEGTILNYKDFNHNTQNGYMKLCKDYGAYKIFQFLPKYGYSNASKIPINIWYNGRWVLEQGKYMVDNLYYKTSFSPILSHHVLFFNKRNRKYNIIDLETGKFIFPCDVSTLQNNEEEGWLYGSGVSPEGKYHYFYIDKNGKNIFPEILQYVTPTLNKNLHLVIFKNNPTYAYIISTEGYPIIVNKNNPLDIYKKMPKKGEDNNSIVGIDRNGAVVMVNAQGVQEMHTENYKQQFFNRLNKLQK